MAIILTVCILIGAFWVGLILGLGLEKVTSGSGGSSNSGYNGGGNSGYSSSLSDSFYMSSYGSGQSSWTFAPSSSGYYTIKISDNDNRASIYVYVDGSIKLNTSSYSDSTSVYMSSGTSYSIRVYFSNNSSSDRVYIDISK